MRQRIFVLLLAAALLAVTLAACNQNQPDSSLPQADSSLPAPSQLEQNIAQYELLVSTDPSAENYRALAGFYGEAGRIKKQRDTLERGYRLNGDAESLDALQSIVVNMAEEDEALQEKARLLSQNLSLPEYQAEAVAMLISPDWHAEMMPKLRQGHRNYYWENPDDQSVLNLEVGYNPDNAGAPYTRAWRHSADGQLITLLQEGAAAELLTTGLADGQYEGEFSSWLCVGTTGTVYNDTGTFAGGVLTGDYTSGVYSEGSAIDLFSLFSTRENFELTAYTGGFENGVATAKQPAASSSEETDFVAYAYTGDGANYLTYQLPEGAEPASFVFDYGFLGLTGYPVYTPYTPVPDPAQQGEVTLDLSKVQVRVVDSVIEWFDGTAWHPMGGVEAYMEQDPFRGLDEPAAASQDDLGEIRGESGDADAPTAQNGWYAQRGGAQTAVSSQSQSQSQSASSRSQASTASTTTPAQSTPAPAADPAPTPAPAPAATPAPQPDPTPAPEPQQGDGEDIEWTPDIL